MDLNGLREPFSAADIEWRIGRAGKNAKGIWATALAYIDNRAIMDRFDEVCGPGNWKNEYTTAPNGGVLCGLSVLVDGQWVTKWDGADNTEVDPVKGGLSGAMKRAGVQWGVGRYLYGLTEGWAQISDNGANYGKTKDGDKFRWDPPALPKWALPGGDGQPTGQVDRQTGEVTGDDTESSSDTGEASAKQAAFIASLVKSHHITDDERDKVRIRLLNGITRDEASKAIEWLQKTIAERELDLEPVEA